MEVINKMLGFTKKRNIGGVDYNRGDLQDGAKLLYRYREENIKLAGQIKDVQGFISSFQQSEQYSQKELFGMLSSISNILETTSINLQQMDSSISKEKLEQVFSTLTNNAQRVEEILNTLLESINKENQQLSQFIKSNKTYVDVSVQIEQMISQYVHEQDALRQELATLMPNIEKVLDQTDFIETQEVESLAVSYITYYFEFEELAKNQNSTNEEVFSSLEKICLFLRKLIGNLEHLNQAYESEFLFELGLHVDSNHKELEKEFERRGISKASKTHPKKFAQNFFKAERGKTIVKELEESKEKEEKDKLKTIESVLKRLSVGIKGLNDSVKERFKEKIDTSQLEEEFWQSNGSRIANMIVDLNNHIRDDLLSQLTGITNQIDKKQIKYSKLVFNIPSSNFENELRKWENNLLNSLPKPSHDISKFTIDDTTQLLLQNKGSSFNNSRERIDPQNIQELYANLSVEEQQLYNELNELNAQLSGGSQQIQELIKFIDQMSQRAKTTEKDKKGNTFTQEFPNMHEAMGTVYWRIQSLEKELNKLQQEKDEKNKKLKQIIKKIQNVQLELERVLTRAVAVQITYDVELRLLNIKTYYDEVYGPQYVGKIIEEKDKKDNEETRIEIWKQLNKGFSSVLESFNF